MVSGRLKRVRCERLEAALGRIESAISAHESLASRLAGAEREYHAEQASYWRGMIDSAISAHESLARLLPGAEGEYHAEQALYWRARLVMLARGASRGALG